MSYLARIDEWKNCISDAYVEGSGKEQLDRLECEKAQLFAENADIGSDLEISFREVLGGFLKVDATNHVSTGEDSNAFKLLKFAFGFAVRFQALSPMQISKLPFIMMEDIMECQTIEKAESTWQIIESLTDTITHPDIFPKGKLTVLRMCNSLLRKLSKSCNTEFCGRVLMFLAAIYPLSEKSALNLSGKVNTNNLTYFESEIEYLTNAGCPPPPSTTATGAVETKEAGDGSMGVAEHKGGEGDASEEEEVRMDIEARQGEDPDLPAPEIAYDMYKAFWRLQSFFASDQKAVDSVDLWRDFMQHARTVVQLFETYDFTDEELQQARAKQQKQTHHAAIGISSGGSSATGSSAAAPGTVAAGSATESGSGSDSGYSGCKYLTSSQLFSLQLRDPIVRQQVAVQILYFVHYLRTKSTPYAPPEHQAEVSKDMLFLHDKACRLVERSPNDGAKLVAVLKRLLSREARFISWKTLSCPEIEIAQPALSEEELARRDAFNLHKDTSQSFALYKKRPQRVKVKRSADAAAQSSLLAGYQFDYSDAHVKSVARELVKNIPTYEEEIQQYVDAEDPDAGIEEEYHPKKNNLYCWRARRLMAAQHLHAFEAMLDGDIGKGLRKLNNQPEPTAEEGGEVASNSSSTEAAAQLSLLEAGATEGEGGAMVVDGEALLTAEELAGLQREAAEDVAGDEMSRAESALPTRTNTSTSLSNLGAAGGGGSGMDRTVSDGGGGGMDRGGRGRSDSAAATASGAMMRNKRKLPAGKPEAAEDGEEVEA